MTLQPLLKWPGGKRRELKFIQQHMPSEYVKYYEPFLGGGAVYFSIPHEKPAYVNDISEDLMSVYQCISTQNQHFLNTLLNYSSMWEDSSSYVARTSSRIHDEFRIFTTTRQLDSKYLDELFLYAKWRLPLFTEHRASILLHNIKNSVTHRFKKAIKYAEKTHIIDTQQLCNNFESGWKAGVYNATRELYNNDSTLETAIRVALYFVLREIAYASMFRFDKYGKFNVPYGGIGYNKKSFRAQWAAMQDKDYLLRFETTQFENMPWNLFLRHHPPTKDDFIFFDPPYDTTFSAYDQTVFDANDHSMLAAYFESTPTKCMIVVQKTQLMDALYISDKFSIIEFDKSYAFSIKNRVDKKVKYMLITNY